MVSLSACIHFRVSYFQCCGSRSKMDSATLWGSGSVFQIRIHTKFKNSEKDGIDWQKVTILIQNCLHVPSFLYIFKKVVLKRYKKNLEDNHFLIFFKIVNCMKRLGSGSKLERISGSGSKHNVFGSTHWLFLWVFFSNVYSPVLHWELLKLTQNCCRSSNLVI